MVRYFKKPEYLDTYVDHSCIFSHSLHKDETFNSIRYT